MTNDSLDALAKVLARENDIVPWLMLPSPIRRYWVEKARAQKDFAS